MTTRNPPAGEVTALQPDASGHAQPGVRAAAVVRWTDGGGDHECTLDRRMVLGSGAGVDVVVLDPAVSRLHAELDPRSDGLWVRDLGSRNGTFIEAIRVAHACVPEGGRIRVGSTTLTLAPTRVATAVEIWPGDRFGPLIGRSPLMRELFVRLARVAASQASVLLAGETGTGKELVARAIHDASAREQHPYIVVDCGALPENLLESEFFGHAKGAFTGAAASRAGAFETANRGTVFLDEIGELPLAMQPKLLRVLESRMVRRLGETAYRDVDVRFVSATHRDLRAMVNAGAFREDLYFRLAVVPITLPALRDRPEDIPPLIEHFLPPAAGRLVTEKLLAELVALPWLGNVRELRNFVDRLLVLGADDASLLARDPAKASASGKRPQLPAVPLDRPFKDIREEWLDHLEREYVRGLLDRHGGNITTVAQAAGIDRTYVHRLMRKHDL